MAIEAPYSRYKKQNFLIVIGVLLAGAIIFGYDGFLSQYEWSMRYDGFYTDHVINNGGVPDDTFLLNQKLSPGMFIGAIAVAAYFMIIKGKKIVADDNELKMGGKTIAYDSIEKVNKANFDSKGYFVVTYTDASGTEQNIKISDRSYDNLPAVLDCIVEKIS